MSDHAHACPACLTPCDGGTTCVGCGGWLHDSNPHLRFCYWCQEWEPVSTNCIKTVVEILNKGVDKSATSP